MRLFVDDLSDSSTHFFFPLERRISGGFVTIAGRGGRGQPVQFSDLAKYISKYYTEQFAQVESGGIVYDVPVFIPNDGKDICYFLADEGGTPKGFGQTKIQQTGKVARYLKSVFETVGRSESILHEQVADIGAHFLPPKISRTSVWVCDYGKAALGGSECFWMEPIERRRAILLGEPGAGKTTLLRRFALEMVSRSYDGDRTWLLPVYLQLRNDGWRQLDATIRRRLSSCVESTNSESEVLDLAGSGHVILLLDGIDEVIDEQREECIKEIKKLDVAYPNMRIMLTCRFAAYHTPFRNFDHYSIDPLSSEQVRELALIRLGERSRLDQFIGRLESEPALGSIVSSPLLLTFLITRFQRKEVSPHHIAQVLSECVNILVDSWDSSRGIVRSRSRQQRPAFRRSVLATLACLLVERSGDVFSVDDLKGLEQDSNRRAELVAAIASATGIVEQVSQHSWKFAHVALMHYLAATFLVEEVTDIRADLYRRTSSSVWQSIWRYVCGITSKTSDLLSGTLPESEDSPENKLKLCLLITDALSESMSLTPSSVDKYGRVLAHCASELLDHIKVAILEPATSDENHSVDSVTLVFPTTPERAKGVGVFKSLLKACRRLRDGMVFEEVIKKFRASGDSRLIEFARLIEIEGRVRFFERPDTPEVECVIRLRRK